LPFRILAYGDSLTAGFCDDGDRFEPYGTALADALQLQQRQPLQQQREREQRPVEVWVCGLSGAMAQEMVEHIDSGSVVDVMGRTGQGLRRILQEQGPFHLALIMAGTNDLADLDGAQDIASSIQKLHSTCHEVALHTVALAIPPSKATCVSKRFGKFHKTVNASLETWANATNGLATFVQTESLVPWTHGSNLWEEDGLHLSPLGSSVLGCKLAPLVCTVLLSQAQLPVMAGENNEEETEQQRGRCGYAGNSRETAGGEEQEKADEEEFSEETLLHERGPMPQRFCPRPNGSHTVLPSTQRILAFGDSLTAGHYARGWRFAPYGAALAESLLPDVQAEVWVCGLSGMTAREMAAKRNARQLEDVCRRHGKGLKRILRDNGPFDLALIMAGTNDLASNDASQAGAVAADIQALHAACHAVGVRTVVLGIPPRDAVERDMRYCRYWKNVNKQLENWAQATKGLATYIDTAILIPFARSNGLWESDGLHLSNAGSRQLGEKLVPAVRLLLQSPRLEHRGPFCRTT